MRICHCNSGLRSGGLFFKNWGGAAPSGVPELCWIFEAQGNLESYPAASSSVIWFGQGFVVTQGQARTPCKSLSREHSLKWRADVYYLWKGHQAGDTVRKPCLALITILLGSRQGSAEFYRCETGEKSRRFMQAKGWNYYWKELATFHQGCFGEIPIVFSIQTEFQRSIRLLAPSSWRQWNRTIFGHDRRLWFWRQLRSITVRKHIQFWLRAGEELCKIVHSS